MTDFVITLPLRPGEEAQAFGDYLNRFVESRSTAAIDDADADAPFVMVRTNFGPQGEVKTVIFQEQPAAAAFSSGWRQARRPRGVLAG
ncbi:MAG: hypothetical protein KY446_08080 [Proteobacteria bacterium]|nr:hypothetical protein [Pseudomonadota bacterium]